MNKVKKLNHKQNSFEKFGRSQRFSIRKYQIGAASVLLGTALVFGSATVVSADSSTTNNVTANQAVNSSTETDEEVTKEITDLETEKVALIKEKSVMEKEGIPTHYVTDGTIQISEDYTKALLEQTEYFRTRAWWDAKDESVYNNVTENNKNHELLTKLSEELSKQTYDTTQDTRPVDEPTQLTEEQQLELNYFGIDLVNQIRNQTRQYVGTAVTNEVYDDKLEHPIVDVETPKSMFDFAVNVTDNYKGVIEAGWSYDNATINKYAEQYGLRTVSGSQKQEEIKYIGTGSANPKVNQETLSNMTMGQLKGYIYEGIKRYLFEPEFSGNVNRRWEKAGSVTGLNTDRRDQTMAAVTLSFSQNTNWTSEVVYVPTVHLFLEQYDHYGVPGNFTWTDKDGNGKARIDGSEHTEKDSAERKFDKTLLQNGNPEISKKYDGLVSRIGEIDKRLEELKLAANTKVLKEYRQIPNGFAEYNATYLNGEKQSEVFVTSYTNKATVKETEAFKTRFEADDTKEYGTPNEEIQAGQDKVVIKEKGYTYYLNANGIPEKKYDDVKDIPGQDRVVKVGTKPTTKTEPVDFTTIYIADSTLEAGEKLPVTEGVKGEETVTITYLVDSKGNVTPKVSEAERTKEPIDAIIKVGTKSIEKTTSVPFTITYQPDETLALKETKIKVTGVEGESTETISYRLNKVTGEVTSLASEPVITKAPVTQVVLVGIKPTKTIQQVPFATTYEEDPSLEVGQTKIKVQGVNGEAEVTTSYLLDTVSGQVIPGASTTVTIKAPVTQIELVGKKVVPVVTTIWRQTATGAEQVEVTSVNGQVIGEKVLDAKISTRQETPIPFKIELFEDETKAKGSKVLVQKGVDGKQTTGVIYTVVNGELVTTPLNEIIEPVTERIAMGTKPASQLVQTSKPAVNETKKPVVSPAPAAKPGNGTVQSAQPLASATQAAAPSQSAQTSKATLPNTGEKENISMTLGATLLSMALGVMGFKKREN